MPDIPIPALGEEQSPHLAATYAYIIEVPGGTKLFLVGWDQDVTISNVPARYAADEPQVFTASQLKHGAIVTGDKFEARSTTLMLPTNNEELRRFFTTSAPVRLAAWIIRILGTRLTDTLELDWDQHCYVVEGGKLSNFAFQGVEIACTITPEAFHTDRAVPRFYFERQCNHPLYGEGCGLDKTNFDWATTIVSVNPAQREIIVTGQASGVPANRFQAGHLFHDATGLFFTIAWSAYEGSDTKLKLLTWHPDLAAADTLTAYHGCRHTIEDCALFANLANFGGFPKVPSSNPTIQGVV